ncbi:fimbrial protein [Halomonas halmophila]|uniref:Ferrous iron transporter B n=1 Tax=Halomonas halmophila TaxID=252 RepID=A0A4Y4F2S7_9GAMM|nr:fimbrial protein [Halomonas halmophila]GED23656.1 ferrous iron transporter B [Halomonas halmophila]
MKVVSFGAGALGMMLSGFAFAAQNGTVNFEGEVVNSTCNVVPADQDKTVVLPTVSVSALDTAGATAGATPFSISLENCTVGDGGSPPVSELSLPVSATAANQFDVSAYFEPGGTVDSSTGRLINTASDGDGATNVQIELLNSQGAPIAIREVGGDGLQPGAEWYAVDGDDGAVTMNYFARYHATGGPATAGVVSSTVDFTLTYQ